MSQISFRIRNQVKTRLAAVSDGFNVTLAALASTYSITPFSITFGANSRNFFQGQINPRQLEETSSIKYPLMTLYSLRIDDDNEQKFQLFSGLVQIGIDVHVDWKSGNAIPDFELMGDAIEDAIVQIMNRTSNQAWDFETVYNGNVSCTRYPLQLAAGSWRQTLRFGLKFEVHEQ